MDLWLSEDQRLIQGSFRDYLDAECQPSVVRQAYDTDLTFDWRLWAGVQEVGATGVAIPEQFGGLGLGMMELALLSEELGRHAAPFFLEGHNIAGLAIALGGSPKQQGKFLPDLASGDKVATLAMLTMDRSREQTTPSTPSPSVDRFSFVPLADVANLFVVELGDGRVGVLERDGTEVEVRALDSIDCSRKFFEITFDPSAIDVLSNISSDVLSSAALTVLAADAFGAATKLVEETTEYAKTRRQFGFPIGQFQSVKHQLAELALSAISTRGLFWDAAMSFDNDPRASLRSASMAKAHITQQSMYVARQSVELHGAIGFTWECDVQLFFKRIMFDRNYLGTPEFNRERCATLAGWGK